MNKVCTLIFALLQLYSSVQKSANIEGKVTEINSGEPIIFATVALYKNGGLFKGIETDLDGNYFLSEVQPGTYDMEASLIGYAKQKLKNIVVKAGRNNIVHFQLSDDALLLNLGLEIKEYNVEFTPNSKFTTLIINRFPLGSGQKTVDYHMRYIFGVDSRFSNASFEEIRMKLHAQRKIPNS